MADNAEGGAQGNDKDAENIPVKCVMFGGEGAAGKTSMFIYYFHNKINPEYVPPKVETDNGIKMYTYKETGKKVGIYYDDHEGGGEDWDSLRHLGYERAHVVVLCFSIYTTDNLERIEDYWYPFVKKYAPKAKILLCATQIDLRTNQEEIDALARHNERLVTTIEGKQMAEKIKAVGYFECSTHEGKGVNEVFEAAAEATMHGKSKDDKYFERKDNKMCSMM